MMAVFSISALLAQGTSEPLHYTYPGGTPRTAPVAEHKASSEPISAAVPIPAAMHFCAQHCLTFTLERDGTLVNRTNLPGQSGEKRVFKIESFTPESVVIHRTDYGSFPGDGIMTGRMQYGNNTAYGQGWAISWGAHLNDLPESDQDRAQREGIPTAAQQQISPLALFLGLVLGGSDGGGDPASRISSLADQVDAAKNACYSHTGRSGQPANDSSCDRQRALERQLSEARADLREEIENLTEAHDKLASECNAGDKESCEKQQKVDAQLAKDRQSQFGGIFQ